MLIYEKDNKLNINFENSVDGEPDLQIGKEDGKTEVLIDGQSGGGGSNAPLICTDTGDTLDKTMGEIQEASLAGRTIIIVSNSTRFTALSFTPVCIEHNTYVGNVRRLNFSGEVVAYVVDELTEEAALAAYPTAVK